MTQPPTDFDRYLGKLKYRITPNESGSFDITFESGIKIEEPGNFGSYVRGKLAEVLESQLRDGQGALPPGVVIDKHARVVAGSEGLQIFSLASGVSDIQLQQAIESVIQAACSKTRPNDRSCRQTHRLADLGVTGGVDVAAAGIPTAPALLPRSIQLA